MHGGLAVVTLTKSYNYFFFFSKLKSISDFSKLKIHVSSRSALTDTWVGLSRKTTTVLNWAWSSQYSVPRSDLIKTLTLTIPSRVTRYTLSRGATVRKKKSREQYQAHYKSLGFLFFLIFRDFDDILLKPRAWFWTLRDLAFFFYNVRAFSTLDSTALNITRLSVSNLVPVVDFISIE